jgi:hypothetical protein
MDWVSAIKTNRDLMTHNFLLTPLEFSPTDDNDVEGAIASPSGEGIADIYAALRMGDSCIGRGFFYKNAQCIRNIDYMQGSGKPKTMSNNNCKGDVHCLGGVYSEAVWSLYKRKLQSAPYNYDDNTA